MFCRRRLVLGSAWLLWLLLATAVSAEPGREQLERLEPFMRQELAYDISFLWFDRLAEARFRFLPGEEPETYRAVLEARTLGMAAWLTKERIQNYEAVMTRDDRGMFHSKSYSSTIYRGSGQERRGRTKTFRFDYPQRRIIVTVERNGVVEEGALLPMSENGEQPSDVLTAFFNFYSGVYGELEPGQQLEIPTFAKKGSSTILIEQLTQAQRPRGFPPGGQLCRVTIDDEVFESGGGHVYVWFDDRHLPVIGVVEKVLGMGDVRGTLRN